MYLLHHFKLNDTYNVFPSVGIVSGIQQNGGASSVTAAAANSSGTASNMSNNNQVAIVGGGLVSHCTIKQSGSAVCSGKLLVNVQGRKNAQMVCLMRYLGSVVYLRKHVIITVSIAPSLSAAIKLYIGCTIQLDICSQEKVTLF